MEDENGTLEKLDVESLILDRKNPRVARFTEIYEGEITDEQMGLALGAANDDEGSGSTTFHSLRSSIKTHGGLIHPILVHATGDGRYVVIEGNTRAMIFRQYKREDTSGKWDRIPAIVYRHLDMKAIDAIRLQAHLVGPREWDPYSKAKYLNHLRNSEHLTIDQIVDFCGGQRKDVLQLIDAYHDMEGYYRPLLKSDDQFDQTRFSAFVELQAQRVSEALVTSGYSRTDFAGWIKDRKLFPLNRVRILPAILANPQAREIFLEHGAREAEKVLNGPSTAEALNDASLVQLANALSDRINSMSYPEVLRLREGLNTEENRSLTDARDQLIQLCVDIAAPPPHSA